MVELLEEVSDLDWKALEDQFGGGNFEDSDDGDDGGGGDEGLPEESSDDDQGNLWVGGLVIGGVLGASAGAGGIYAERSWLHAHKVTSQPAGTIAVDQGLFNTETLAGIDVSLGFAVAALGAVIATKIEARRRNK